MNEYSLELSVAPVARPYLLDDYKIFKNIPGSKSSVDMDNKHFEMYLNVATDKVESYLQRKLIEQTWILRLDKFPTGQRSYTPQGYSGTQIPYGKLISITDPINVYGSDGTVSDTLLIADNDYEYDNNSEPAVLIFNRTPAPGKKLKGIEITYKVGYGTSYKDVPESIRMAIMAWASAMTMNKVNPAALFNKQKGAGGRSSSGEIPEDVLAYLSGYQVNLIDD